MRKWSTAELSAALHRGHRMSVSDPDDPNAHTLWGDAAAEIDRLAAELSAVTQERDGLSATVETVRAHCQVPASLADAFDDDLDDVQYGERAVSRNVLDILAAEPADILRSAQEAAWDAGVNAEARAAVTATSRIPNPHRKADGHGDE